MRQKGSASAGGSALALLRSPPRKKKFRRKCGRLGGSPPASNSSKTQSGHERQDYEMHVDCPPKAVDGTMLGGSPLASNSSQTQSGHERQDCEIHVDGPPKAVDGTMLAGETKSKRKKTLPKKTRSAAAGDAFHEESRVAEEVAPEAQWQCHFGTNPRTSSDLGTSWANDVSWADWRWDSWNFWNRNWTPWNEHVASRWDSWNSWNDNWTPWNEHVASWYEGGWDGRVDRFRDCRDIHGRGAPTVLAPEPSTSSTAPSMGNFAEQVLGEHDPSPIIDCTGRSLAGTKKSSTAPKQAPSKTCIIDPPAKRAGETNSSQPLRKRAAPRKSHSAPAAHKASGCHSRAKSAAGAPAVLAAEPRTLSRGHSKGNCAEQVLGVNDPSPIIDCTGKSLEGTKKSSTAPKQAVDMAGVGTSRFPKIYSAKASASSPRRNVPSKTRIIDPPAKRAAETSSSQPLRKRAAPRKSHSAPAAHKESGCHSQTKSTAGATVSKLSGDSPASDPVLGVCSKCAPDTGTSSHRRSSTSVGTRVPKSKSRAPPAARAEAFVKKECDFPEIDRLVEQMFSSDLEDLPAPSPASVFKWVRHPGLGCVPEGWRVEPVDDGRHFMLSRLDGRHVGITSVKEAVRLDAADADVDKAEAFASFRNAVRAERTRLLAENCARTCESVGGVVKGMSVAVPSAMPVVSKKIKNELPQGQNGPPPSVKEVLITRQCSGRKRSRPDLSNPPPSDQSSQLTGKPADGTSTKQQPNSKQQSPSRDSPRPGKNRLIKGARNSHRGRADCTSTQRRQELGTGQTTKEPDADLREKNGDQSGTHVELSMTTDGEETAALPKGSPSLEKKTNRKRAAAAVKLPKTTDGEEAASLPKGSPSPEKKKKRKRAATAALSTPEGLRKSVNSPSRVRAKRRRVLLDNSEKNVEIRERANDHASDSRPAELPQALPDLVSKESKDLPNQQTASGHRDRHADLPLCFLPPKPFSQEAALAESTPAAEGNTCTLVQSIGKDGVNAPGTGCRNDPVAVGDLMEELETEELSVEYNSGKLTQKNNEEETRTPTRRRVELTMSPRLCVEKAALALQKDISSVSSHDLQARLLITHLDRLRKFAEALPEIAAERVTYILHEMASEVGSGQNVSERIRPAALRCVGKIVSSLAKTFGPIPRPCIGKKSLQLARKTMPRYLAGRVSVGSRTDEEPDEEPVEDLDEAGDDSAILIQVVRESNNAAATMQVRRTTKMKKLIDKYSAHLGVGVENLKFVFNGANVSESSTALSLGVNHGDVLYCLEEGPGSVQSQ